MLSGVELTEEQGSRNSPSRVMSVTMALVAASNTLVELGWTNMAAISWRWTGVLHRTHTLKNFFNVTVSLRWLFYIQPQEL